MESYIKNIREIEHDPICLKWIVSTIALLAPKLGITNTPKVITCDPIQSRVNESLCRCFDNEML